MSNLEVWLIILLVIGVILSNIAVLKYSAKFKMPQFGAPKKPADNKSKVAADGTGDDSAASGAGAKSANAAKATAKATAKSTPNADSQTPPESKPD
ncbi:DUF2897 family protein [Shewanella litorisediminis]|uniref:DUF2897 family protein n=1 Tax=Shewanella litorisediminis TaxID=1173586 RepID=UPI001EF06E3E|nr:DUF2897 family protein [Shewanella litorisediminis]MCL2919091.1 DUF2897 family protein [Shewanella litorisediminis]